MSEVVQEPSGAPTASTTGLFVRNATGLVRDITGWDAFNLVFAAVLVPLGFLGIMAFVPEFWPHANLLLAFVIAGPLVAFVGAVYVYFTIIMPRSGGDYVWVSRTLHPGIAFMVNVGFTYGYLTWVAINFNLGVRVMMPSFAYIGGIHSSWLANPTRGEEFAIVTVLTIFYTGLMIVGTRYMARFMSITFFIVWIGVLVWALLMLFGSHSHFVSQWNAHSGATYAGIMAQARKLGFTSAGAISVGTTLYAMVYCFNAITGFQWTGYFAGEVRNVRKNAYLSIFGALVAGIVGYVALTWLVYHYYGTDFMKSLVYMGFGPGTAHYTLGFTPYVSQLLNFLPGGQAFHLVLLVCVFFMAVIWWTPAGFMLGTRNAFAWSFDRIAPERLSETSDRFHTPVWATVFIGCVVELLCFLNIYSNLGAWLLSIVAVFGLCFIVVCFAAGSLPWRHPDLHAVGPDWAKAKILGIPVITICSVIAAGGWGFVTYASFKTGFGSAFAFRPVIEGLAVPLAAGVWYLGMRAYRRHQGIDLHQTFLTIPPE